MVVVWYRVIIVSALSLSLRDKDRLRDRESLTKMSYLIERYGYKKHGLCSSLLHTSEHW